MSETLVLHEYAASGNCYKVRLTAALVGRALERREYDIVKGETRTPQFLSEVNANGRIPVLQVGDRLIPESNAACHYIADGSQLVPSDAFDHADMLRWMFWEQYITSRTSRPCASGRTGSATPTSPRRRRCSFRPSARPARRR